MAGPIEDKGSLTERLEEDRQRMAAQVSELKKDYNVPRRMRVSIQKNPWPWIMGALLGGFLLSRLPARRKKVYLWPDPKRQKLREVHLSSSDDDRPPTANKLWSLAKPIISTYVGRQIYKRVRQMNESRSDWRRTEQGRK
jgi:hypothetical protein